MSLPINLLITTLLIYVVRCVYFARSETKRTTFNQYIRRDRCTSGVLGIVACIPVLISSDTVVDVFKTPFEFASFSIRIDGLAALWCVLFLY